MGIDFWGVTYGLWSMNGWFVGLLKSMLFWIVSMISIVWLRLFVLFCRHRSYPKLNSMPHFFHVAYGWPQIDRDTLTWPRAQTTLPQKFVGFDLIIRILVMREERPTSYVFIWFYASSKKAVNMAEITDYPQSFCLRLCRAFTFFRVLFTIKHRSISYMFSLQDVLFMQSLYVSL